MKSNPEERPLGRSKQRWWNQVKAHIELVGAAEGDGEDLLVQALGLSKYIVKCICIIFSNLLQTGHLHNCWQWSCMQ